MIRIQSLHRHWGEFALRDINLDIRDNEYFVILGPCGSGKTLLLETIAGLYTVKRGAITINNRDVTRLTPEKRRVSLVYQQYALFPHLSVRENIAYGLRYRSMTGRAARTRVDEMIDLLGIRAIAERNSPNALSGGEAQKVALARALAIRPEALLLDEPLSSLDPPARERVMDILGNIRHQLKTPIIHVTHNYFEATALADRVGIMRDGVLAQSGSVQDVFRRPASRFVAGFIGVENVIDCTLEDTHAHACTARVGSAVLRIEEHAPDSPQACLCIRPEDIRLHRTAEPNAVNLIPGMVKELRHDGFSVRIQVRTEKEDAWIIVVPENIFSKLAVTAGMSVYIELPPHRLHLMRKDTLDHAV
jgi:molybdate/tungstate transport system ATP-binding protein